MHNDYTCLLPDCHPGSVLTLSFQVRTLRRREEPYPRLHSVNGNLDSDMGSIFITTALHSLQPRTLHALLGLWEA